MDDLLREFLTESAEHLETIEAELVRFERNTADAGILRQVIRPVHAVWVICGSLRLTVGVHRLDSRLLVLDVDALLTFRDPSARAARSPRADDASNPCRARRSGPLR